MEKKTSGLSISAYFSICIGLTFVVASTLIVAVVNREMRNEALSDARERTNMLLERNLATHQYFTQEMKPKIFEKIGQFESEDYFEPTWMSSTYAIRQIDKYFDSLGGYDDYYYKECAVNARSPQNEADDYERAFIEELNKEPDLLTRSEIRKIDGRAYFVTLHRGEMMEESCLRCHSTPDNAPGDMVSQYGSERGFNRHAGDAVTAISIRVPLTKAYAATRATTIKLSILLMVILGLMFSTLYVFTKKVILHPLRIIEKKSSEISFDPKHLGDKIPLPHNRELGEVVSAFNNMSVKLRDNTDNLEQKVLQRTSQLEDLNQKLVVEVEDRTLAEERLQKVNQQLQTSIEQMPTAYILRDRDFRVLEWNNAAEHIFGYTRDEVLGRRIDELIVSQSIHPLVHEVLLKLRNGESAHYSEKDNNVRKDGTVISGHWHNQPLTDDNGNVFAILSIVEDVTERKQVEKEIEDLAKFPEENPNPVLRFSSDGTIIYANAVSSPVLQTWRCKVGERIPEDCRKRIDDVFRCGRTSHFEFMCSNGQIFDVTLSPVTDGGYANAYARDISEIKNAQEILRVSEERFRRAVLNSPFPIMIHADDGEVLQINKVWTELTGYEPDEIQTLSEWTERAYGERKDIVKSRIDKIFDCDTRIEEGEYTIKSKEGKVLIWDFSSASLGKLADGRRLVISMGDCVWSPIQATIISSCSIRT
ncbi:MAG: PAS domain S-box protein [Planctomycetota bacterium]|jgi:PAS domain S-box-containing protein